MADRVVPVTAEIVSFIVWAVGFLLCAAMLNVRGWTDVDDIAGASVFWPLLLVGAVIVGLASVPGRRAEARQRRRDLLRHDIDRLERDLGIGGRAN